MNCPTCKIAVKEVEGYESVYRCPACNKYYNIKELI